MATAFVRGRFSVRDRVAGIFVGYLGGHHDFWVLRRSAVDLEQLAARMRLELRRVGAEIGARLRWILGNVKKVLEPPFLGDRELLETLVVLSVAVEIAVQIVATNVVEGLELAAVRMYLPGKEMVEEFWFGCADLGPGRKER